ncbi:MAG: hypothetical protein Q7S06_00210 [Nanoarchaeota archaeon]|nr:hypothetical protein [Nanoarchaeota archaeon]
MVTSTYYAELILASLRLLLIVISTLICIEIAIKSLNRLRRAMIFFAISLIPSALYTIGRIVNVESMLDNGKLLSLSLNFLTSVFILLGLWNLLLLVKELIGEIPEKKEIQKERTSKEYYKVPQAKRKRKPKRRIIVYR